MRLRIDTTSTRRSRPVLLRAVAVLALHPSIAQRMWSQLSARAKPPGSAAAQLTYRSLSNTTAGARPAAHLGPRSQGGCDHPDCVVPLCWTHHRAYAVAALVGVLPDPLPRPPRRAVGPARVR